MHCGRGGGSIFCLMDEPDHFGAHERGQASRLANSSNQLSDGAFTSGREQRMLLAIEFGSCMEMVVPAPIFR